LRKPLLIIGAVLLAALLAVGWDLTAPGRTVRAMIAAAKSNDMEVVESHVDLPAIKANVQAGLQAQVAARGSDKVRAAMMNPVIEGYAESFASLGAIRITMAGLDDSDVPPELRVPGRMEIARSGLNRFRVARGKMPVLVFERRGLTWKLTGIDLPSDGGAGSAQPETPAETPRAPAAPPKAPAATP
jgi:hypothetical protein